MSESAEDGRQRAREGAISAEVVTSVAHTSRPSARVGSSGSASARTSPARTPAVEQAAMDGPRVGHADDELVEVRARDGAARRRPRPGPPRARRPAPRRAPRRRAARAGRWSRGRSRRPARGAPGWCRCCWPPCRAGCPARARAWSSRTRACRRGRSSSRRGGRGSGGRARRSRRGCRGTARRTAARSRAAGPRRPRCRRRTRRAARGRPG